MTFIIIIGCRPRSSSLISGCSDYPDRSPSPPHGLVNLESSEENAASLRYDRSKQEILQPVGGSHSPPAPPTTSDYGLNLIPSAARLEGLETQVDYYLIDSIYTHSCLFCMFGIILLCFYIYREEIQWFHHHLQLHP